MGGWAGGLGRGMRGEGKTVSYTHILKFILLTPPIRRKSRMPPLLRQPNRRPHHIPHNHPPRSCAPCAEPRSSRPSRIRTRKRGAQREQLNRSLGRHDLIWSSESYTGRLQREYTVCGVEAVRAPVAKNGALATAAVHVTAASELVAQ